MATTITTMLAVASGASGSLTVTGSTVSGNAATGGGGGIYGAGNLTVTNSAVSGNSTAARRRRHFPRK